MKQNEMIILAVAGFVAWNIMKPKPAVAKTVSPVSGKTLDNFIDELFTTTGTPFENGWRYYENGTAIDPSGNYYFQGQKVYSAPSRPNYSSSTDIGRSLDNGMLYA